MILATKERAALIEMLDRRGPLEVVAVLAEWLTARNLLAPHTIPLDAYQRPHSPKPRWIDHAERAKVLLRGFFGEGFR